MPIQSKFKTMAEVRAANTAAGYHFFDHKTMRFWKSRIESKLIQGRYFITSEDDWSIDGRTPARMYVVREVRDDASIKTLVSHLRSKDAAKEHIKGL